MFTINTDRLTLRELSTDDAEFIYRLVNEPSFLRFIGDKGVRTLDDAQQYILNGPIASYQRHGFGLYLVEHKTDRVPIGMCGLLKRETLADVDIGFAFIPEYWNQGYAIESATAVFNYGKDVLKLPRIVAITNKDNDSSGKLLEKLGLRYEKLVDLNGDGDVTRLFVSPDLQTMRIERIHQIAVFARDLDEAVSFYRDLLGATFIAKFDPPGLAFFDFAGTRILLEKNAPKATIYFRVANIHAAHNELVAKGVKFIDQPHMIFSDDNGMFGEAGEEEWMTFFSDPSENTLALASRVKKND
ncbi:MAG TPA: GNAT family N-acetyltransferase [Pyrinomonadaceae bacterium]